MTQREIVNGLIAYDNGDLDEEGVIDLFQVLVDTGTVWSLRVAARLVQEELQRVGRRKARTAAPLLR